MPDNELTKEDRLSKAKEWLKKNRGKIFGKKTDQKPVLLKKNKDKPFGIERDEGDDLPMSKESSPTVTDTETGETTFGKPQNFSCGGMGKAVRGGKFIGVK